ncbi:MAG TPA: 50S ribosomal protein L35 [Nitrospiraceae bacterium]|jgi:large subunit ribosomal protein L35
MPKMKTHSGVKKRFQRTGSGKVARRKAGRRHLLTSKASNRKRRLSGSVIVDRSMTMAIKRLTPYN